MRLFFHQLQLWYQGSLYLPLLEERRIPELSLGLGVAADCDNVAWACHQEESLIAADTWCVERRVMPVVPCSQTALPGSDDSLVADVLALVRPLAHIDCAAHGRWERATLLIPCTSARFRTDSRGLTT
jgi:hypothetical protein